MDEPAQRAFKSFHCVFDLERSGLVFVVHDGCNSGFSGGGEGVGDVVWPDCFSMADDEIFFEEVENGSLSAFRVQVQGGRYFPVGV